MKRVLIISGLMLVGVVAAVIVTAATVSADDGQAAPTASAVCIACHSQAGVTVTFQNGDKASTLVDAAAYAASPHGVLECTSCHPSITGFPHPAVTAASKREFAAQVATQCATCHPAVNQAYSSSVHAGAQTNPDLPACTDCHSILHFVDPATAEFRQKSVQLCSQCHGNAELMQKYGLSTNVVKSYLKDFHGVSVALITAQNKDIWPNEAVCTDCHGVHDIKSVTDPASPVIAQNLQGTCASCHPGANMSFPTAWLSHYEPSVDKAPAVFAVQWFYRVLIPFILIGLAFHIIFDIAWASRKKQREATHDNPA